MVVLAGKVALVTGSSRGIGAAIAKLFAGEGAKVAIHGRDEQALAAAQRDIESSGGQALTVAAELTRLPEVESMREKIERKLGPLDILVANAGGSYTQPKPFEELTEDEWRKAVDGNLTATFFTLKSFLPGMKQRRRGNIQTISSAAARRPHEKSPIPYAVSKAAIELLTQDVALQAGPFGIRVNCIAPEIILTGENQKRIPDPVKGQLAQQHPLRRLGTPEDVARASLFLASEESAWITGVVLDVAGGAVMVR